MIGAPEIILLAAVPIVFFGCLTNWAAAFKEMQAGHPLIPKAKRDNVPWGLLDLGAIVVAVAVMTGIGVAAVTASQGIENPSDFESLNPREQATVFLAFGTATLLATALSFGWLWLRYQRIHGFSVRHLGSDVELGVRWFIMLIVPVVVMQLILTRWFPTKHPLIEMLRESRNLSFLPVVTYAAVVAAPVFEEAFFRLFLQGWLEKVQITVVRTKLGLGSKADNDAVLLGGASSANLSAKIPTDESNPTDQSIPTAEIANPYDPPSAGDAVAAEVLDAPEDTPVLWIPIFVSSGLFALAHFSHGPDWVPLFFLALGLGYLYQRTGRIQACMVVHMLVNGLGVLQLWAAIRQA